MEGNGVSLQTTIVQMGNVAQTQAKSQHTQHPTAPFSDRLDPSQDATAQRVRKTEAADRKQVDPDAERDRRHRDKRPGQPQSASDGGDAPPENSGEPEAPADSVTPGVGQHVDTRA